MLEVAEGLKKLVGNQVKIELTPACPGDFGGREIAAEQARRELGWQPSVEFEDGLRRTVEWFRQKWGKSQPFSASLKPSSVSRLDCKPVLWSALCLACVMLFTA